MQITMQRTRPATGLPFELFEGLLCHSRHVIRYIYCIQLFRKRLSKKVHATITNGIVGDFRGDVTGDDSQRRFLAQHSIIALLRHCSNIATLCCAKNRRCQSPRVTLPLVHCSSKKFERMARGAMDIRLRLLKESKKGRF